MAKRFLKPTINWKELESLVPPDQKANYMAFKAKADVYLRRVQANPEKPPSIDWEAYSKSVPVPGLVDKMKKGYESMKVPYPEDTLSAKVDEQWASLQPVIKEYCAKQQTLIDEAKKELSKLEALPSFESMTMEMFYDLYTKDALDPVKRPTFWPHSADEQPGYVEPERSGKK